MRSIRGPASTANTGNFVHREFNYGYGILYSLCRYYSHPVKMYIERAAEEGKGENQFDEQVEPDSPKEELDGPFG